MTFGATIIIIAITTVISFYGFSNQLLISQFIMNPYRIKNNNEYYRFITSGFIHGDHMHLLFNMFSFYFFGTAMEAVFGVIFGAQGIWYFLALYILGIVVSDIPSYFKHRNNPGYNALGASGGVASVIFAFIIFLPLENIYLFGGIPVPGFILGTAYIIFSWYQGRKANDNINHDAHLYGALFGLVFCIVFYPQSLPQFFEQISQWPVLQKLF